MDRIGFATVDAISTKASLTAIQNATFEAFYAMKIASSN